MAFAEDPQRYIQVMDPQSQSTQQMTTLLWVAGIFSFLVLIGTGGALWYVVNKFKVKQGVAPTRPGASNEPPQFHGNNTLEAALIGVPVLIVVVLSVMTASALGSLNKRPDNIRETIQVDGWQFWWDFNYTNQKIRNSNELVIPVNAPIELKVSGKDVIHSFGVANLGGRRDALPGQTNRLIITASKPGVYYGQCFELCGPSHANMLFRVIVLEEAAYNDWLTKAKAFKVGTPTDPELARGQKAFQNNCAGCHAIQGQPGGAPSFPDLSFFGSRLTFGAGIYNNVDESKNINKVSSEPATVHLEDWIRNAARVKPGSLMPAFDGSTFKVKNTDTGKFEDKNYTKLSEEDITAIAKYLRSLKLEGIDFTKVPEITKEAM